MSDAAKRQPAPFATDPGAKGDTDRALLRGLGAERDRVPIEITNVPNEPSGAPTTDSPTTEPGSKVPIGGGPSTDPGYQPPVAGPFAWFQSGVGLKLLLGLALGALLLCGWAVIKATAHSGPIVTPSAMPLPTAVPSSVPTMTASAPASASTVTPTATTGTSSASTTPLPTVASTKPTATAPANGTAVAPTPSESSSAPNLHLFNHP